MELFNIEQAMLFETKFNELENRVSDSLKSDIISQNRFESILEPIKKMEVNQLESKVEMSKALMGSSENAHNALIGLEKAKLEMQLASVVRDKVVTGINQMLNMQI